MIAMKIIHVDTFQTAEFYAVHGYSHEDEERRLEVLNPAAYFNLAKKTPEEAQLGNISPRDLGNESRNDFWEANALAASGGDPFKARIILTEARRQGYFDHDLWRSK